MILLIDPDKEGFGLVVKDSTALGPVPLHTGSDQVLVPRHEQKVIVYELLAIGLLHAKQGEVFAGQVTFKLLEGALHEVFHVQPLLLGDSGRKAESFDATTHANTGTLDGGVGVDVAFQLVEVHVGGVAKVLGQAVIFKNERVEDIGKVLVGIGISSIDSAVLIVILNSTSNSLNNHRKICM